MKAFFKGYSDDIVNIVVYDEKNGKFLFDDEAPPGVFDINGDFSIYADHTEHGWTIGLCNLDEDKHLSEQYDFKIAQPENPYSPIIEIQTNGNLEIKEIFGGPETQIRNIARDLGLDRNDEDRLVSEMRKNGFLT